MSGKNLDPRDSRRRFDGADLTRRILDRTSGRACERAELLLGSRWDAALETVDGDLLAGHLQRCAACRELATVLDGLQPVMPRLAEREPGPAFTARVLARTSRLADRRPLARLERLAERLQNLPGALRARLASAWRRPRFALEAAWTAATLVALLVWSPLLPAETPEQAARAGVTLGPELVQRVETLAENLATEIRDTAAPLVERVEPYWRAVMLDLDARYDDLKRDGRGLLGRRTANDTEDSEE